MKILITGNMGYVGPVVVAYLRAQYPKATLHGYDNAYFAHCLTGATLLPEQRLDAQMFGDVRNLLPEALEGYDAIVHLAAVSNDPMGNRFAAVTSEINYRASVDLARMASEAGVRCFVFASSCSIYGVSSGDARKETDPLNPVTAYAKSKIATELGLEQLDTAMTVTCLRFATACGMSDRLRLDLVLNDFVACALSKGEITVLSDGTPWRPLIDVRDMARAVDWAINRAPEIGGRFLAVNVGADDRNYQVKELAAAVAAVIPGVRVGINIEAPADSRSYKVDFSLYAKLAPNHQPVVNLTDSITGLQTGLQRMGFADENFRASPLIRLKVLDDHISERRLSTDLHWL